MLIYLNTKACKVMQIYFSNSKWAAKGSETLLFWLLSLPGGKSSYSFLEGPLKWLLSEASSFLLLLDIASSLLMFHASSSLSHSEVENVHTESYRGFSEPCVPTAAG